MASKGKKGARKPSTAPLSQRRDAAFRYGLIVLISIWMFILGVLVGRGTAPVRFDMEKIQEELAALKDSALQKEMRRYRIHPEEPQKPQLDFYDVLKAPPDKVPLHMPKGGPPPPPQAAPQALPPQAPAEPPPDRETASQSREKISLKKKTRLAAPVPAARVAASPKKPAAPPNARYTIQVASLKDKAEAQKMVARLQKKGYPAYQVLGKIPGKGIWYRVRVGGYERRETAAATLRRLKQMKYNAIVIRK